VWPLLHVPVGPPEGGPPEAGLRHEAERLIEEAAAVAAKENPAVPVSTDLITGAPAPALLREVRTAELVVLGDRGLGGFSGLLVGSVAVQVAAHSPVPVLVAKGRLAEQGLVVVGVDGSPESLSAVECAFQEAAYRRVELVAVHGWTGADAQGAERLLSEAIAGHRERFPDVTVRPEVIHDRPARALVKLSEDAQLVVVGSRGPGGFTGLLLGSVSQQVLHHSRCPVLIVRHP